MKRLGALLGLVLCGVAVMSAQTTGEVSGTTNVGGASALPADSTKAGLQEELLRRLTVLEQRVAEQDAKRERQVGTSAADAAALADQIQALKKTVESLKAAPTVSGQMFANYGYVMSGAEGKDYNRFDIERFYLTVKAKVADDVRLQFTSDVYRNSAAGSYYSGLTLRVKFAFVDYAVTPNLSVKAGMVPTPWTNFADLGYWKYRVLTSTFADRNGFFQSADLGAVASWSMPDSLGEASLGLLNGSGYTAPEANKFKDLCARVNVLPLRNLGPLTSVTLAGYYYKGSNSSAISQELRRDRFGALLGLQFPDVTVNGEYHVKKEAPSNPDSLQTGTGISVYGEIHAPFDEFWRRHLSLVARHDIFEPNVDKGGDVARFTVLGIAWKFSERITLILDHQWTRCESATVKLPDASKTSYEGRWFLHSNIQF